MISQLTEQKINQLLESGNYRNSDKLGEPLSDIEMELLKVIAHEGIVDRYRLALKFKKSHNTIRNQIVSILDKLNLDNSTQAVSYYYQYMIGDQTSEK